MSALEILVVIAVLVGVSIQAAIGFGFAFCVAPAAFAAYPPEEAVTFVLILAIAINSLVLFSERRTTEVARRVSATVVVAALPGMLIGVWVLERVGQQLLQVLVGVVILTGAAVQIRAAARARREDSAPTARSAPIEIGGGFTAGLLTTSVSVNGPVLVLALSHLGLRGRRLRDSLAATLLGVSLIAAPIVLATIGLDHALPGGVVLIACIPALLLGHRLGAAAFGRLDEISHHRLALGAAALAGALSIAAAVLAPGG